MRLLTFATVLVLGASTAARAADQPQAAAPAAVPVGVVTADRRPITETRDFVGRVEAMQRVEIRARVTGFLEDVQFTEGDMVKDGAPLYKIERGLFEAAVGQAEGALARSKASQILTEVQLQRAEELLGKGSGTQVARDQALAADQQAKGQIVSDEASLKTAQINLGYTEISAPITGKIGRTSLTKGNVVDPSSGALAMIVSQDPMYVTFPVSQREFLRTQQEQKKINLDGITAHLRFSDGSLYKHKGSINFVDVTVNRTTDTVLVRATFPNPDFALVDGQFVAVGLEGDKPEEKVVVPQAALISDQQGIYVFIVTDGKAEMRRVKTAGGVGSDTIVTEGLNGGEQVVVEGLQTIRPGAPVRANPVASRPDRS